MKMTKLFLALLILAAIVAASFALYEKNAISTKKVTNASPEENTTKNTITSMTIVSFGDSLTAGYGLSLEESYPSILEKRINQAGIPVRVINMGVSGETTTGALERLEFVASQNPDIVLLGLGANDMLRGSSPDQAYVNLEKMITYFKGNDMQVVLLGMKSVASNGGEYAKKFDAIYPTLAEKYSLPLVPFFLEGVALNRSLNIEDGIHPNKDGYERIVDKNILPILLPYIKK